jgi:alpha-muurolene/germacrene-A/gamma-muurolene synthase
MIVIFMVHHNMTLQEAFDKVGDLCRQTMDTFSENIDNVPSFGSEQLDRDVRTYIQGLQDWIVGSLHWSFMTERYFGKDGDLVKKTRIVKLLEREA